MQIRFNWKITAFSVICTVTFVSLGLWQVERGYEKTRLLEEAMQRRDRPGVSLSALPEASDRLDAMPVSLRGVYDTVHIFLLDNRVLEGRVGFEVLVPFYVPASDTHVLVNRGFVPMGRTRNETPEIPPIPGGEQPLSGHVYVAEDNVVVDREGNLVAAPPWPIIVQVADPVLLQLELDKALYPHVIRLAEDDTNALPRNWPVTTIMPERHWGYAVQWFVMALVVAGAWLAFSVRRPGSEDSQQARDQHE